MSIINGNGNVVRQLRPVEAGDGHHDGGDVRLRLTRRGRVVIGVLVTMAVAALLAGAGMFAAAQAQASAEVSGEQFTYVVAEPGDSLWSLATRIAPGADPRDVIDDVMRLNQLQSVDIEAGQQIAIPKAYDA